MTPLQKLLSTVSELEKLEAAATPGPWSTERYDADNGYIHFSVNDSEMQQIAFCHEDMHPKTYRKDAALIAASKNSIPALCSAIRLMGEALDNVLLGLRNQDHCECEIEVNKVCGSCFAYRSAEKALQAAADRIGGKSG